MFGIKHLGADIDLQRDADVALGHHRRKENLGFFEQGLPCALLGGLAPATAHAHVQVNKGVVSRATGRFTCSTAIGHRVMRRWVSQYTRATGWKDLFAFLVFHGEHGVGHLAAQGGHVDFSVQLAGVKDHKMWHGFVLVGRNFRSDIGGLAKVHVGAEAVDLRVRFITLCSQPCNPARCWPARAECADPFGVSLQKTH